MNRNKPKIALFFLIQKLRSKKIAIIQKATTFMK